ncbi:MAG TPA: carbamoyltransferase HypF [Bryobacteraceae bacterium]
MRRKFQISGIVQGVGFRPWVYQLAQRYRLYGYVFNSTLGVTIEVEGTQEALARFEAELRTGAPPLAQLDQIRVEQLETIGYQEFTIRDSQDLEGQFVLVPPDIATCPDCLADLRDPANRRYRYPFTNCTNCGPRYTIIQEIPYDRPHTTMAEFRQCPACEREYHDPGNRRFHAQPNACPACGPWVELWDRERLLSRRSEAIDQTRKLLKGGAILAIKGLGGFHLACDASNDAALGRLRQRKLRSGKPFALMAANLEKIAEFCELLPEESAALSGTRRPIVLLARRPGSSISTEVAPGVRTLGVMLPYTPLHHLLFEGGEFDALVMTSANVSEEPIAFRNEEVAARLHPLADYFLLHNRAIQTRVDDSVVRVFEGRERLLRRSRGYAPRPIELGFAAQEVLACGGELKNTFCLTKEHHAILSQHTGDLENLETLEFFEETLAHMKRFFRVEPCAVAYDLHPQYMTTRMALAMPGLEKIGVQHHHAHIAACMAENGLREKVIGVALDGTGYGTDGRIWGGEFLICDYLSFERRFHFRYVPLPGGDTAIRQPWRSALSYLRDAGLAGAPALEAVPASQRSVVEAMLAGRINTVDTSSCGRLFDAVSAILGIRMDTTYEGQAAIELEAVAAPGIAEAYPYLIDADTIDFRETIRAIVRDPSAQEVCSARFHNTVSAAIAETCRRLRAQDGLTNVCLSGGTFQNAYLLARTAQLLRAGGFQVFLHATVPPNDGGLSLGQAAIASSLLRERR